MSASGSMAAHASASATSAFTAALLVSPSGVRRPGLLADRVSDARLEATGRRDVAHRLSAADLRREIAEQRQLFHQAEVVRPPLLVAVRRPVRVLLAIELLEQLAPLRRRCGEKRDAV